MKWRHLTAVLWLRWRMSLNQARRAGPASAILLAVAGISVAATSVGLFFAGLIGGALILSEMAPGNVMLLWDGVVAAFLLFWVTGLVIELERSEILSLQKLLHLPMSPSGTFVVNYLGSLASLSLAAFVPGMAGLSIAMVATKGAAAALVFPLLAGFLLMVTAVTYQLQGWLAALMMNKRKRRAVLAIVPVVVFLLSQLPNLLGNVFSRGPGGQDSLRVTHSEELARLDDARKAGRIGADEYGRRYETKQREYERKRGERKRTRQARTLLIAEKVNLFVPVGWLPYGAMACARGRIGPALLGAAGAGLIGAFSLWRSYRTTVRLYKGHFSSGKARRTPATGPTKAPRESVGFLETSLPGLSEHATTVALANLRSLARAPEARMVLLTPAILALVFSSMLLTGHMRPPESVRPFMGLAAIGLALLSLMQLLGNQFGLDRDGFRAYVLSASPRRDILLGKNLSVAPLAIGLGALMLAVVQLLYPMRIDHLLATLGEMGSSFLLFCIVANFTSILSPVPLASGSLRPAHPKAGAILVQFLFLAVLPVVIGLAVLPLGVELVVHHLGWLEGVPIYLLCTVPELGMVAWLYGRAIGWQGRILQRREQQILTVVTTKVE